MAEEMSVSRGQTSRDKSNRSLPSARRARHASLAALACAVGLACLSSTALGASTHPFKEEWSVGSGCTPRDVATDAAGNVYVACEAVGTNGKQGAIRKFSPTGATIPFTAPVPYVAGNEITEDPGNGDVGGEHQFGPNIEIDVDKSSANPGFIYVSGSSAFASSSESIDIFAPSGEYLTSIPGGEQIGEAAGVGLDQNGRIYVAFGGGFGRAHISIFEPNSFQEVRRLVPVLKSADNNYSGACCNRIRPDTTGGAWVGWGGALFGGPSFVGKWEADQFGTNLTAGPKDPSTVLATSSPYLKEAFPGIFCPETWLGNVSTFECSLPGNSFDVDFTNNDVYMDEGSRIVPYSNGVAGDPVHQDGPAFGEPHLVGSRGVDIRPDGTVIAAQTGRNEEQTVHFTGFVTGDKYTLTCPNGEATAEIEWSSNISTLVSNMRVALEAKCGAGNITLPFNSANVVVRFVGIFSHIDVPPMICTKVTGSGSCEIINELNGAKEGVVTFEKGATLPTVTTKEEASKDIGHTTATARGLVDPANGGVIEACQAKYGENTEYKSGTAACEPPTPYPNGSVKEVSAPLTGLTVGKTYHYRFEATNANGTNIGGDRIFEAKAVLQLETKAATNIDRNDATLQGQLDADGLATEYFYEYGATSAYGLKTLNSEGKGISITGAPGEILPTPFALGHLLAGHTYHYRLVAKNSLGTTKGKDVAVRTASPPLIEGVGAENVTDSSADIHAVINPVGYASTYVLEYGINPSYGQSLPPSPEDELGAGNKPVTVNLHLEGLPAGSTIHYRVRATNEWGTSETDDTTFNFRPPACPNAHVRQVTGTSYLPDCRAYELVSPGYAGAVQLMPGEGFTNFAEEFGGSEFAQYPQNFGYATGPSRFTYLGALGSIQGLYTSNALLDVYLATRTNHGWVTTFPGLKGDETTFSYGRVCSDSMDLCVDHVGSIIISGEPNQKSSAPFLYRADGTRTGRLPTNVNVVKNGTKFRGDEELSGDFSHFVFSTLTPFTPEGSSKAPGAIYDNALGPKTLTIASKLPNGEDLPPEASTVSDPTHMNGIAAVSQNGSRIIMAGTTQKACDIEKPPFGCPYILGFPARLYLRVNDAITYDVSRGEEVNYVGATRDDSKIFFTTSTALLPGKTSGTDSDHSADLYMWEEQGDRLTLISQEGSLGNRDDCNANWNGGQCNVTALTPERAVGSTEFDYVAHVPGVDDLLANQTGDVYFYSPEDLVEGQVGGENERNLYLYRNGHLQLVSALDPGTQIERITVSTDGSHAAFLTKSSMTAYNSEKQPEVYAYNADTNTIRCASCNPSGAKPQTGAKVVTVAESGPFMANDGRAFFATKESLVPQDTDGIRDFYEYVDGRAQLISSGTGEREGTGGLETLSFFFGSLQTSLEAVSRDGADVYFSTFESLVPEDQNGSFIKMYDARAAGGFDFNPELGPCAAADECHGSDTSPPAPAAIGTGGNLGSSGNLPAPPKKHKKKKKKHHKRSKRHAHRQGGRSNG
jgi:hypothetical protein